MHIEVYRTGGFAGITQRHAVDTAGRSDGARLESLARAALAAPAAETRVIPDGFVYEITVDARVVRCADPHLTAAQRQLISAVLHEGA
ncbi:protealysin inhibitor emfourin [Streptomyces sp. V4-01]|uniref:Protealysin inhibitor emfourin n=1 Tax=Actinacidiphila polyblastidii TaxID=3110430 RepID=A0ABU7PEZ2_9ACTN|nr:protealysin inhibitor emfourin [Streptomyces sp. V4-01]